MKRLAPAVAVLMLLVVPSGQAAPARIPSAATATAAFGHFLHGHYGDVRGYWTCPQAQAVGRTLFCMAEVHIGGSWHQVSANAKLRVGRIVFSTTSVIRWMRHWWPYSRRFMKGFADVPGVISVNRPTRDWGFLTACAHGLKVGHTLRCDAYDGDGRGLFRFYRFTCTGRPHLVACWNGLDDAMRYHP